MKKIKKAKINILLILILFLFVSAPDSLFAYGGGDGPSAAADSDSYIPPSNTEWDSVRWDPSSGDREFSHLTFEEEFGDGRPAGFTPYPWTVHLTEQILGHLDNLDVGTTVAGTPANGIAGLPFAFLGAYYSIIRSGTRMTYSWATGRADSDNRRTSENSTVDRTKKRLWNRFVRLWNEARNRRSLPADGLHPSSRIR